MVPALARMAVIIKADHDTNIITGNYEMAYICGLFHHLTGTAPASFEGPEDMQGRTLALMENYVCRDGREENLLRMLKLYKPEKTFDDQVGQMFHMGLSEKRLWQR